MDTLGCTAFDYVNYPNEKEDAMPKFKVFEEHEQVVCFKLEEFGDGIVLKASRGGSEWWNILSITDDGALRRGTNISEDMGLKLNVDGAINVKE